MEGPTEPLRPEPRTEPLAQPARPEIGGIEITRRFFVTAIVAVCVASAAIGSAISLVAQTGPRGERGPAGPRGPEGQVDTAALEAEIEALRSEADISGLEEQVGENEERIEELEGVLQGFEASGGELCDEEEIFC